MDVLIMSSFLEDHAEWYYTLSRLQTVKKLRCLYWESLRMSTAWRETGTCRLRYMVFYSYGKRVIQGETLLTRASAGKSANGFQEHRIQVELSHSKLKDKSMNVYMLSTLNGTLIRYAFMITRSLGGAGFLWDCSSELWGAVICFVLVWISAVGDNSVVFGG